MCPRITPPSTAYSDARAWLDFAARHFHEVLDLEAINAVSSLARGMVDAIARALCLVYDGQRLDVVCPWCAGRTEAAPVGGEKTWRVRELPGDLIAIVCESGTCEPPPRSVGTWWRGQPAWPIWEWDWLAKQMTAAQKQERIAV